jgi:methyl coenzyme M reductase subunit C
MAEIVGLASAITALAALGFKLANGISDLAEELGTIGSQLRSVATDTKAVALVLHELKKHIKSTKNITKSALEIAHEIIAQCQVDIEDLDRCIQPFFIRDEEPRTLGWIKRMQWLFAKSKLATRKAALDSLKLTISMYIAALGFIDGDDTE